MPMLSKNLWFQCQAFPNNALVVLWYFKDLRGSKSKKWLSPNIYWTAGVRGSAHAPQPGWGTSFAYE
jgi:hypothetical protein